MLQSMGVPELDMAGQLNNREGEMRKMAARSVLPGQINETR